MCDDEDPRTPDIPPKVGTGAPSELEPEFVGHVHCEEEMEDQSVLHRPSSGKRVLIVNKKQNECFFLKWKTFNMDQRKGRELDPRNFDQI